MALGHLNAGVLKVQLGVPLEQYMYLAFGTAHHNIHKFRYYSLRIKI